LALDEPKDTDKVFEIESFKYLIDQNLIDQVKEVKIDFVDMGWQKGFSITSQVPVNGGSTCGSSCNC
jgi:Fe-S cluster assembly iron-binding protein IscA